jgi:hypothetical protein
MGRLALAQVAELERRGMQPYRAEAATNQPAATNQSAETNQSLGETAKTTAAEPVKQPQDAASPPLPAAAASSATAAPRDDAAAVPSAGETTPPAEAASWVDEPYLEWVEETPAMLAAQSASGPTHTTVPTAADEGIGEDRSDTRLDVALPQPRLAHPPRQSMEAADRALSDRVAA